MDFSILKDIIKRGNFTVCESFENWETAVKASVQPFINNGLVKEAYADRVVEMVHEYRPYICICPHVAIPHAMAPELVLTKDPVISFMKVNQPVAFSDKPHEQAELFFALATPSSEQHLEELQVLVSLLEQEGVIEKLLLAKTKKDFEVLIEKGVND